MKESMFRNRPSLLPGELQDTVVNAPEPQVVVSIVRVDQGKEFPRFVVIENDTIIACYTSYEEMLPELPEILQLEQGISVESF